MSTKCQGVVLPCFQLDENIKMFVRLYDQSPSEPEKSPTGEGRNLKPETPEPDGDSNQERAKDRGNGKRNVERILYIICST